MAHSHPADLASPAEILIEASNGASAYGNCFGEPLIYGFTRTYGIRLPDGYRSWYKPIMYSVGAGQIRDEHTVKGKPQKDMLVVQVGGPAYRIGMGGGAASSMEQGANVQELDFNAVQRGDPEMEQRVNRLMRACTELGAANPIVSAHDLGAGGRLQRPARDSRACRSSHRPTCHPGGRSDTVGAGDMGQRIAGAECSAVRPSEARRPGGYR